MLKSSPTGEDKIECVILAGGQSSRMGEDKSLLPFKEEESLAFYQYRRLGRVFDKVYISCKSDKFGFTKDLIIEKSSDFAPAYGLLQVVESLGRPFFVLGVDTPFISKETIMKIVKSFSGREDAVVARSKEGLEPLCGVYTPSIKSYIETSIATKSYKLGKILELAHTKEIYIKNKEEFLNINTPKIYHMANSRG